MNVTHESDWTEHKGTQMSPPMRHLASVSSLVQQDTSLRPEPNSLLQGCHLPVQSPLGNSGQVLQTISPLKAGKRLHQLPPPPLLTKAEHRVRAQNHNNTRSLPAFD